ncbi:MAG: TonB-dependent receptor [Muribaculaceae bacterium]|nr:TonB-dependent receptor [Muribaculaceae bacterium]
MKLAISAILLIPLSVAAQTELPDTTFWDGLDLDEVVVTGTRVPRLLKDSPVQTRLITAKDIARTDATDIEDLLQAEMPGVEFSYAMNQQVHMNFGGFGGQSVLFLIDGERMAGETMDDVDFSRIDMNNVERIEIVRGASSALYGSNAGGGVINIITKEAAKKFGGNLDFRIARHNDRRYILGLSNKSSHIRNNLSLTASRMDSYDVHNATDPITRVISTIYGHKTLNVKEQFSYLPFAGLKITARAGFYMRELPREIDAPERYRSYTGGIKGCWDMTRLDHLEVSYSFDQYDKSQLRSLTGMEIRNYSNVQNSVRGLYNHYFGDSGVLTFGTDYMRDYLLNTRLADAQRQQDTFDIFSQYDWSLNKKWEVVGTLRYDYFSDGRHSHFTPKVSARYTPLNQLNLRAAYGMGFRAPTLKEKYYEFDMGGIWIVKGNPDLKPELSHNLNVSADFTRGQYNFTATAYYNYVENRITTGVAYYLPGDNRQLYLDYVNLADFHSSGAELSAQAAWNCGLSAKLSYAYTYEHNVRDRNGNEANNQYMPARPHSLTARINWYHRFSEKYTFDIGLNGRFLSAVSNQEYRDYYDLSQGTVENVYPAYTLWKLSIVQTLFGRLKLTLALDNLFNYKPEYYYLNAPLTDGISFMAGLAFQI